ncbi:DNA-binding protein [Vibrio xuii]|nr:DNA-binding protein [Vibrio xuii]
MITPIAVRLVKGDDLKLAIQRLVEVHQIQAGSIASCVGCFSQFNIRLAGATQTIQLNEPLEIVSVMGTLTPEHQHIHLSVAKESGEVVGGHLMEGCLIDTTAELIIHSYHNLSFEREFDEQTGFTELVVHHQQGF